MYARQHNMAQRWVRQQVKPMQTHVSGQVCVLIFLYGKSDTYELLVPVLLAAPYLIWLD